MAYGAFLLFFATLAALCTALFNYFVPGTGIHMSAGAMLVVCSTGLLLIAVLLVLFLPYRARWRWLLVLLNLGIFLDIIGSGFAGYFLEEPVLMAFLGLALIGWLADLVADPAGSLPAAPRRKRRETA